MLRVIAHAVPITNGFQEVVKASKGRFSGHGGRSTGRHERFPGQNGRFAGRQSRLDLPTPLGDLRLWQVFRLVRPGRLNALKTYRVRHAPRIPLISSPAVDEVKMLEAQGRDCGGSFGL